MEPLKHAYIFSIKRHTPHECWGVIYELLVWLSKHMDRDVLLCRTINILIKRDITTRDPPIMLKILPIMLCCTAQKLCLLCSNYAHYLLLSFHALLKN